MDGLEVIAEYLRQTVLTRHNQRPGRSHCGIDAQRKGIELMVAMGVASPAFAGEAWDIVEAKAQCPFGWTEKDVAVTIMALAFNQHRLRMLSSEIENGNIGAGSGLSAAIADASTIAVLEALGLVQNQMWSTGAFEVFQIARPLNYLLAGGPNPP